MDTIDLIFQGKVKRFFRATHILIARECGDFTDAFIEEMVAEIKTAIRVLNGYIRYLERSKEEWGNRKLG